MTPTFCTLRPTPQTFSYQKGEFFIDNLLVRVHFIIIMIRWTGLAPQVFELPFPGSRMSTFISPTKVKAKLHTRLPLAFLLECCKWHRGFASGIDRGLQVALTAS